MSINKTIAVSKECHRVLNCVWMCVGGRGVCGEGAFFPEDSRFETGNHQAACDMGKLSRVLLHGFPSKKKVSSRSEKTEQTVRTPLEGGGGWSTPGLGAVRGGRASFSCLPPTHGPS